MVSEPIAIINQPRRPVKSPRAKAEFPMLVTRISANHYTVTSQSDPFGAYDVRRDAATATWGCECLSHTRGHRTCKHIVLVQRFDGYRAEPVTAPTASQVAEAAASVLAAPLPVRGALAVIRDRNRRIYTTCHGDEHE